MESRGGYGGLSHCGRQLCRTYHPVDLRTQCRLKWQSGIEKPITFDVAVEVASGKEGLRSHLGVDPRGDGLKAGSNCSLYSTLWLWSLCKVREEFPPLS